MIPFDGHVGFDRIIGELRDCGYRGNFTLELNYDRYAETVSKEAFVQKAFHVAADIRRRVLAEN